MSSEIQNCIRFYDEKTNLRKSCCGSSSHTKVWRWSSIVLLRNTTFKILCPWWPQKYGTWRTRTQGQLGLKENSAPRRTRPPGELGPKENSIPRSTRPQRELGPKENSAPRRTRPQRELGPQVNSAPRRTRPQGELGPKENSAPR